jgi:hypothetical protein
MPAAIQFGLDYTIALVQPAQGIASQAVKAPAHSPPFVKGMKGVLSRLMKKGFNVFLLPLIKGDCEGFRIRNPPLSPFPKGGDERKKGFSAAC